MSVDASGALFPRHRGAAAGRGPGGRVFAAAHPSCAARAGGRDAPSGARGDEGVPDVAGRRGHAGIVVRARRRASARERAAAGQHARARPAAPRCVAGRRGGRGVAGSRARLGDPDQALVNARLAVARYRALLMEAESTRSEWTIGMALLARGDSDEGLRVLRKAAAAFDAVGMSGDAGFVQLDVVEQLLRRGEWSEAEATARELFAL